MPLKLIWIPLWTILYKEMHRVFRLWMQTLLPSVMTTSLYYLIFGHVIGARVGLVSGYSYGVFIAPGLIMMQIIMSAYSGTVSAFFHAKFQRSIEEILVSSTTYFVMLLGFVLGGVIRGLLVGLLVILLTRIFVPMPLYSLAYVVLSAVLAAFIFSLLGLINGIFAKTFDDIAFIPTFFLTPLTYLGGVFYAVTQLPGFWRVLSHFNPIFYLVGTFRYGFLHQADPYLWPSYGMMIGMVFFLFALAYYLCHRSGGLRQ